MGKYWTRSDGYMSEAEKLKLQVIRGPRPGDHISTFANDWVPDDQARTTTYFVEHEDGMLKVFYVAGSTRVYTTIEHDRWKRLAAVGHRKDDFVQVKRGKKTYSRRRGAVARVFSGGGTFVEPPAPPPRPPQPLPVPYAGPFCGETVDAPHPGYMGLALNTGADVEDHVETFTCNRPPHEGDEHSDSLNFVGWKAGFDWQAHLGEHT